MAFRGLHRPRGTRLLALRKGKGERWNAWIHHPCGTPPLARGRLLACGIAALLLGSAFSALSFVTPRPGRLQRGLSLSQRSARHASCLVPCRRFACFLLVAAGPRPLGQRVAFRRSSSAPRVRSPPSRGARPCEAKICKRLSPCFLWTLEVRGGNAWGQDQGAFCFRPGDVAQSATPLEGGVEGREHAEVHRFCREPQGLGLGLCLTC